MKEKNKPCELDYYSEEEMIQFFRDMVNVGHMLAINVDEQIGYVVIKMKEAGWSSDAIRKAQNIAFSNTNFHKQLTPVIK